MDETKQTASKLTKKTNIVKPLATIGIIFITMWVVILLAMVSMISISSASASTPTYKGKKNISIMCVENDAGNIRKASFKYKDEEGSIQLKKKIGDTIVLDTQISLTAGNVQLTLLDPNEKSIYDHIYTAESMPDTVTFPVEADGKYTLKLQVNEASGSYEIKAN